MKKFFVLVVVLVLLSALTLTPAAATGKPAPVTVQILALNDFHGAVDAALTKPSSTTIRPRGTTGVVRNTSPTSLMLPLQRTPTPSRSPPAT